MSRRHPAGLRTWVKVDLSAVAHNYRLLRRRLNRQTQLMAVIKSNGYGHGLSLIARAVCRLGAEWLGVDSITEAIALRQQGVNAPILVLGYTLPERFGEAMKRDIVLTISSFESLRLLKKLPARFHLKVDTGMNRQGFFLGDLPRVLKFLKRQVPDSPKIFEGLYSHFAGAKNPAFPTASRRQLEKFKQAAELARQAGFRPIKHLAATSGLLLYPESHFDLVRVGIGLYGLWPSDEVKSVFEKRVSLRPALSWQAIVSEVKRLPAGSKIGYDQTEEVERDSQTAILPVGYWHGYPRALSAIGHVLVRGQRAKVLGRVSMDMIVVDVTGIKGVRPGEMATLLGRDGKEEVGADELADLSQTINYEIVARLNPLMKRVAAPRD